MVVQIDISLSVSTKYNHKYTEHNVECGMYSASVKWYFLLTVLYCSAICQTVRHLPLGQWTYDRGNLHLRPKNMYKKDILVHTLWTVPSGFTYLVDVECTVPTVSKCK